MMNLITYYSTIKNLSEVNSLGWLQGKKESIINNNNNNNNDNNNNINNNDFQNALDDALNYQTIEKTPQGRSNLKLYTDKYNWKGIKFPAGPEEWKKFERNKKTIALNILYVKHNTKTISVAYRSEYNNKHKKQVILVMITISKKYHYLAVNNLSALLQGKSSNHHEDFFLLLKFL